MRKKHPGIKSNKGLFRFGHKQVWAAFEAVAERRGMSLSALSKSAGLDPTSFNPSKRYGPGGRERWPSTETLSRVLSAADMDLKTFAEILEPPPEQAGSVRPKLSRRRYKRLLSILEGRIRIETQAPDVSCTIRDISAGGARIRVPGSVALPSEFELEIPKLGQSLKVRVVWSRDRNYGVMFLEELRQPLGNDVVALLNALQTPDDWSHPEGASERLAPPVQEAPEKRERRRKKRVRSLSRKSG